MLYATLMAVIVNFSSKKECYFATPTGTPEFPKVLIKRIDDRLLESPNVRIIVADHNAKTVEDVADTLKRTLFLDSQEENCEKRPIIHSLSVSQKNSSDETLMMSSPSKDAPKKQDSGMNLAKRVLRNTPQRISSLKDSESNMKIKSSPRLRKNRSCSPALTENFVNTPRQNRSMGRKKSAKSDGSKALSADADSDILENISTPSKQVRTPRKSRRLSDDRDMTVSADDETIVNTFSSKASGMNRRSQKFVVEAKLANGAGTKNSISTPSPNKRSKMGGRSVQVSDDQETAVTRSGRKVKRVDYFSQLRTNENYDKSVLANSSKHLKKFIRANYSEDSDSGSAFSADESSSSDDEESVSDCAVKEKPLHSSKKKSTNTPKTKPRPGRDLLFSMPKRETPLKEPQNVLEESRLRLHAAAVPKSLPCREEEYSDVYSFVKDNLCLGTGGCMYISGVPGTGKTATVHEVMRNLEKEKNNGEIPCFTFVEVNGMWMTDPYKCYVHIFKSLTGKTIASQQACNLLEKRFTGEGPKKDAVVLLVDELDRLWTRKQTVMYNIFDWPSRKSSKLIVLAIANTMDLPERLMMNRVTSRLGLSRITFQPYNFKQLQEIIMNRIQELKVFDPDAVQFVARKVAAVSGDARRALAICRHAAEIVERSVGSPRKKHKILIGMEHVDEAIQQMFSSPVIAFIKSSSKVAKLFLEGMLDEFTRTGSEETTLLKVSTHVVTVCKFEGLRPPSSSELSSVCAKLAASHVILVDNFQNDIHMKLRLGVDPDDVNYALTGKGLSH
ncbi:Origin recognition complex subunit 1 [Araneus ventricosus]|uniref:Origin recognition complex subunit 1 n=2 Tax=Araneus ventricosus TaxID=182803 RepID=A0A4Y2SDD1_ARAVE|nr:Origin recognition complex subunit 1 [Araneus ventricosus]